MPPLAEFASAFANGRPQPRPGRAMPRTHHLPPRAKGGRAFLKVHAEQARTAAGSYDSARRNDLAVSPFAGIPVSIKDLFDIAGDTRRALSNAPEPNASVGLHVYHHAMPRLLFRIRADGVDKMHCCCNAGSAKRPPD